MELGGGVGGDSILRSLGMLRYLIGKLPRVAESLPVWDLGHRVPGVGLSLTGLAGFRA